MVRQHGNILSQCQARVLIAVSQLRHATIPQCLTYLGYSDGTRTERGRGKKGSYSLIANACRVLCEKGMLEKKVWSSLAFKGRPPSIHILDREGKRWLERNGYPVDTKSYNAAKKLRASSVLWPHTLGCLDWYIAVHRLAVRSTYLSLEAAMSEYHCKRLAVKVKVQGEKTTRTAVVQPDGWVRMLIGGRYYCFALEYDLGHEDPAVIKDKVQAYLKFVQGDYQKLYGSQSLTVLFVTPYAGREARLLAWANAELSRLNASPQQRDLFRFAEFHPAKLQPARQFYERTWKTWDGRQVALLGE